MVVAALHCGAAREAIVNEEIERFSRDLAFAEYAQSTQKNYRKTAENLVARFGRAPSALTQDEVRAFAEELKARGMSPSWTRMRLAALVFLYRRTLGRPEAVSFIRFPKKRSVLPAVLSPEEVHALLNRIENPRLQALAMVMYGAGLRLQEARKLEVGDIDAARGVIRVRNGKGKKDREAKLSMSLYQWLRDYWARIRPRRPYLFASPKTGRLPLPDTIRSAIASAAKGAWIRKTVTPHVLRHSFATHLLENGTDITVVAHLLGHASIKTTIRYARVTRQLVRETPSPLDLLPQRRS